MANQIDERSIEQIEADRLFQARQVTLDQRLRRSQFWRLYLPVSLMGIALVVLSGLLVWVTQSNQIESRGEWLTFTSAFADLIIIFTLLPLMLTCALLPAGILAAFYFSQRNGVSVYRFLLKYLRLSDRYILAGQRQVKRGAPIAVKQVATYRGWIAYGQSLIDNLVAWISPKKDDSNGND